MYVAHGAALYRVEKMQAGFLGGGIQLKLVGAASFHSCRRVSSKPREVSYCLFGYDSIVGGVCRKTRERAVITSLV
jgi:hypothetical protein